MTPPRYRGRFAPSPTGPLHFGSLLAAFASWIRARQRLGVWLVRVEDLDPPREVAGSALEQLRTLQAFGFESDETVLWQSRRLELYDAALQRLRNAGLAFDCRCSRNDLAAQQGIHRGCVASPTGGVAAVRARVPELDVGFEDALQGSYTQQLARDVGDFVLRRVEGFPAYQLAVVVDDAAQHITEVVRGSDLLDSTPRQIWLQQQLGYATPDYLHLPLALDPDGRKLSKSLAALPLDPDDPLPALRAAWRFLGQEPAAIARFASREALLSSAIERFDWERVPHTGAMPR
jgi:glutamyl-Q tRNA(Asp) synthetase